MIEGDLTWCHEHTIQYAGDVLWNCTPESNIILFINVTPINSVINKIKVYILLDRKSVRICNISIQKSTWVHP